MARRRIPPELRRRTWREGTVWELLVTADLLPYRFASPFADLGLRPRERRELHREAELLKTTTIAFILPQPATRRRAALPWLYVRTKRGGHYRVGEAGEIQRYGRRTQRLGSGSITEHGWYPCALRGVRWLQLIATNRLVQKVSGQQSQEVTVVDNATLVPEQPPAPQQLRLFSEP